MNKYFFSYNSFIAFGHAVILCCLLQYQYMIINISFAAAQEL